jgi:hypothetical protein
MMEELWAWGPDGFRNWDAPCWVEEEEEEEEEEIGSCFGLRLKRFRSGISLYLH